MIIRKAMYGCGLYFFIKLAYNSPILCKFAKIAKKQTKENITPQIINSSYANLNSISLHQSQLGINRAVGTSRSRYRACRRYRWSRCLRSCSSD